jgi:hypothetical protein
MKYMPLSTCTNEFISSIRTTLNEADDIRFQAINNILLNELNVAYGYGMNDTIQNK